MNTKSTTNNNKKYPESYSQQSPNFHSAIPYNSTTSNQYTR